MLIEAVATHQVDAALLPVENSIFGPIARSYDLLWDYPQLFVTAEIALPVTMMLIGVAGADESTIREVRSHPVALEQVHRYTAHFPHWRRTAVADTAGAVAEIVALNDPAIAAVGPQLAAELYGGTIIRSAIQDDARNYTRFYLLERHPAPGNGTFACIAMEIANRAGSLRDALSVFADRGINLRSLVARPNHVDPFNYRFFVEVNEIDDARLNEALAAIDGTARATVYGERLDFSDLR